MPDFRQRLEQFLGTRPGHGILQQLTPDASTREYFRITWEESTAIACVYPEAFSASATSYLDVTRLFLSAELPVAAILESDEKLGIIIQEDLGDRILREELEDLDHVSKERRIDEAISLIARIQAATPLAFELGSVSSKLRFDTEKLVWELEFFKTHYFSTYKGVSLSDAEGAALSVEFADLAGELESRASVLCHRDFHAANLMIDPDERLRIIDHQDARIGSPTYDLVSLLLDRVTETPSATWLAERRRFFLAQRENHGLAKLDERAFADEFRLQTIQRCLKAIGTFSFQSANRGKTYFVPFIGPMFEIVLRAVTHLERFPTIASVVSNEINGE